MMWVKPLSNLIKEAEMNSIHHIFKIGDEIVCQIVIGPNQLMCGSQLNEQPPLRVGLDLLKGGRWVHLTFATDI